MRELFHLGFSLAIRRMDLIVPLEISMFSYYDLVAGYAAGVNYRCKPDWMLK